MMSESMGGDFNHGFWGGFAGSLGGSLAENVGLPGYKDQSFGAIAARTAFAATMGGTASVLGGGKFANGAVTAAFQHLVNAESAHGKGFWRSTMAYLLGTDGPIESDSARELYASEENDLGRKMDAAVATLVLAPAAVAEASPVRSVFVIGGGGWDHCSFYGIAGYSLDDGPYGEVLAEVGGNFAIGPAGYGSKNGLHAENLLFFDTHSNGKYGAGGYMGWDGITPSGEFGFYAYRQKIYGVVTLGGGASFDAGKTVDFYHRRSSQRFMQELYGFGKK